MPLQHLTYQLDEESGIAVVTLNTPKQLNSLKLLQIWEMFFVLEAASNDDNVSLIPAARCVGLCGLHDHVEPTKQFDRAATHALLVGAGSHLDWRRASIQLGCGLEGERRPTARTLCLGHTETSLPS